MAPKTTSKTKTSPSENKLEKSKSKIGSKMAVEPVVDLSKCCKSIFDLTFVIEIKDIDVFHDCNEGWIDLGPVVQGVKIHYQLYFTEFFDIDILIWPHVAKIYFCGMNYGWVRTWMFLQRRYLAFSISHAFPVRVADLKTFELTITPNFGLNSLSATAKLDRSIEVYVPPLQFGEHRYFAPVLDTLVETLETYFVKLILKAIEDAVPATYLDEEFDVPKPVTDIRHQDIVLYNVRESILNNPVPENTEPDKKSEKSAATKKSMVSPSKVKEPFILKITGNELLATAGRVAAFRPGENPPEDTGEVFAFISTKYLPAQDDQPIVFINIDTLLNIPIKLFEELRITHLYTRWTFWEETHDSEMQSIEAKGDDVIVRFDDHCVIPLEPASLPKAMAVFLDNPYKVQLRGIRLPSPQLSNTRPKFFGYGRHDKDYSTAVPPKPVVEDLDIGIATTKIDARVLARNVNNFIRGEYSLYPLRWSLAKMKREGVCTNDINAIGVPMEPQVVVVPACAILEYNMNLEVSMGVVGCRPSRLVSCFSRMFLLTDFTEGIMAIIKQVVDINEELVHVSEDCALTGFAVDTGDVVVFYLEGPRDGNILKVWEMTEDFYPRINPIFSTSARYASRIYPELMSGVVPFVVLKMYAPLGMLLACPPIYTRPYVPLPSRSATLKFGRLVANKLRVVPCKTEMPTAEELRSFRLELCSPARPPSFMLPDLKDTITYQEGVINPQVRASVQSNVNWDDLVSVNKT